MERRDAGLPTACRRPPTKVEWQGIDTKVAIGCHLLSDPSYPPPPDPNDDARGWRIALVPDALMNAPDASGAERMALRVLEEQGYGLLQLPPVVPGFDAGPLLAVIADQVAEYAHHGYAVAAVGVAARDGAPDGLHWRGLTSLLRRRGATLPPRHLVATGGDLEAERQRLAAFLADYDIPTEEQRRWRG